MNLRDCEVWGVCNSCGRKDTIYLSIENFLKFLETDNEIYLDELNLHERLMLTKDICLNCHNKELTLFNLKGGDDIGKRKNETRS